MNNLQNELLRVLEAKIEEKNTVDYEGYSDYITISANEINCQIPDMRGLVDDALQSQAKLQYVSAESNNQMLCFLYNRPRVHRCVNEGVDGYMINWSYYEDGFIRQGNQWVSLNDFETKYRNRVRYVEVQ